MCVFVLHMGGESMYMYNWRREENFSVCMWLRDGHAKKLHIQCTCSKGGREGVHVEEEEEKVYM